MASSKRMPDRTGPDGRRKPTVWRARYRDEAGKEHARHFNRQADAQRWLDEVTAAGHGPVRRPERRPRQLRGLLRGMGRPAGVGVHD